MSDLDTLEHPMQPISRDLLWRAWPDGYLAMRGVSTVGGWQCVYRFADNDPRRARIGIWISTISVGMSPLDVRDQTWQRAHKRGDLLPNVDPADTATWACLLKDLVGAVGFEVEFAEVTFFPMKTVGWALSIYRHDRAFPTAVVGQRFFSDIDTDDPAEALVRARIQLREQEGTE